MNKIGTSYKENFLDRLVNDMGLIEGKDFVLENCADQEDKSWYNKLVEIGEDPSYFFTIEKICDPKEVGRFKSQLISHAIMGLVHHFKNRKWITSHSYMYIMKGRHSFAFQRHENETD
jgi:hypothetical protein